MVIQITSSQSVRSKPLISWTPQSSQRFFSHFFKYPTFRSLHNVKYENLITIWPQRFSNKVFWILHSVKFETFYSNKLDDFFIKFYRFQIYWNKKSLIVTVLRDFLSNFSSFVYSQTQYFDCKKPQRFSGKLWISLQMKSEKCVRDSLRFVAIKRSWETCHTPHFTDRCPWNSFILLVYKQNTSYWSFCLFLLLLRIFVLKFSHIFDSGSEIDSKYNINPSFVIIWIKS